VTKHAIGIDRMPGRHPFGHAAMTAARRREY
jgi:hypothetical protein